MANTTISIITVSLNSAATIMETIQSVLKQSYSCIEYIIVDGGSTDGTVEIIESFGKRISGFISEKDSGIYDAINKGIKMSSGKIVGILNSDDRFYDDHIVSRIAEEFNNTGCSAIIGDVRFVDPKRQSKIIRYYSSRNFKPGKFKYGFMPAHPSFYTYRVLFEKFGYYKTDYKIAADFELLLRFLYVNNVDYKYLNFPFVDMKTGGVSNYSIFSRFHLNKEISRACKENGIKTNVINIYLKYFYKIFEYL